MTGDRYQVAGDRYRGSAIKVPVTNLLRLLAQGPKFSKYFPAVIHRHLLDTRTFFLLHFSIFSSTRFQCHYIYGLTFHHIQPWDLNFQHQITAPIHTRPQTSSHTTLGKQLPALDFCLNTHMALHPCTRAMLEQYGNFSNPNLQ